MQFPGTLGVPEPVFAQVLEGIARSLKSAGFKTICFIGDHGGNQAAQTAVAAKLNSEWSGKGTIVLHVADYYADDAQVVYLREQGETSTTIGIHAGIIDTSESLAVHPEGVDLSRLAALPLNSEATGHSGNPRRASAAYGTALLDIRINAAVRQIRAALADLRRPRALARGGSRPGRLPAGHDTPMLRDCYLWRPGHGVAAKRPAKTPGPG